MNSISIDRTSRVFTSVGFIGRFGYMRVVMNMTEWSESWWTTEEDAQSIPFKIGCLRKIVGRWYKIFFCFFYMFPLIFEVFQAI